MLWPVIMKTDRPPVLQAVRDQVVETEIGRRVEDVLGTYTTDNIPQTVSSASSQIANQVGTAVQEKAEEIVTHRIIEEVVKRFETLPEKDKEEVQSVICKPTQ